MQEGQIPEGFSPLSNGICEIKESHDKEAYRVVYIAKLETGIYVLHSFHKKSKSGISVPAKDKDIIDRNFKKAVSEDKRKKGDKK